MSGVCATPNCGKSTPTLSCPTCKKMGLPPSLFCSQDCFKGYWPQHKVYHTLAKQMLQGESSSSEPAAGGGGAGIPPEFENFSFSGPLRPAFVTPMRSVPPHILKPDYALSGIPTSEIAAKGDRQIPVYAPAQIEGIRAACRLGREVLDIAGRAVRVGITGEELDRIVHDATIERGAYPSPLNYHNFPKSVCVSVNEVICHGIPDSRPLEDGDIVNVDVTVYFNGFHADLNETFLVGAVDDEGVRVVRCAFDCLANALAAVRPGVMYRELGQLITDTASSYGFQVTRTYMGHGIGSLFHTLPNVPHYARNKAIGVMKPGHIFTVEPMINVGGWRDITWPDNWTAVTADGKRSAQFEHTVLVTESGCEILTARNDEPIMTWDLCKVQR